SVIDGRANVHLSGGAALSIDARAMPLSLVTVGRLVPSAGLRGSVSGPFHVSGPMSNLHVDVDFLVADGGRLTSRGTLDLASAVKGYDLTARLGALDLAAVDTRAPATRLTGSVAARGRGFDVQTMQATIAANLSASRWDTLSVDSAAVRTTIDDGMAQVPLLYLAGSHVVAHASGT